MTQATNIKFAIIGCGHIGKRHAAMIVSNSDCELVAVCDTINTAVIETATAYAIPLYRSIDELLGSGTEFDVLCIATPNGLHEEHAVKGLSAGHHVLIEKPMALTTAGCEKIINTAMQYQQQVFCVMQNRYSPAAVWLKQMVSEKKLGEIYIVQVNCFWNRDERYYTKGNWHGTQELDGGVLFTQFSHFIDTLLWVFGDIQNINSRMANFNHRELTGFEDSGSINFDLVNGAMGCINFSTAIWNENFESSITVIAEKGTIKIGGQYMNELQYCNIKDNVMPQLAPANTNNHYFVIKNVVDVLSGRSPRAINAAEGLRTVETIERIYKSCK